MNKGKICVSVCAETAEELTNQIRRAEEFADVIEVRLDCVEQKEIHKTFAFLASKKPLLLTYRPQGQGGKANDDVKAREVLWNGFVLNGSIDTRKFWFDYEYDLTNLRKASNPVTIRSFHDFSGAPENLPEIFENLSAESEVAKIAVRTDEISDSIRVWKLLEKAESEDKQIIPIAMGEAGKWTRILGLAHGAFLTYASLEAGGETAPGQISARDLIETYRVRELDAETEIYGIIGSPVAHSLSPYIHNAAFKFHKLNAVFIPFEVNDLDEFVAKFVRKETSQIDLNFRGFSVTIPHKQAIIKHLDFIDETAATIGAVNTVKIVDGKLHGYNTDAQGFVEPLKNSYGNLKNAKVAILGNGGAARACVYAVCREEAKVTIFARNIVKAQELSGKFAVRLETLDPLHSTFDDYDIVVNTTPLGTTGELENETAAFAAQLKNIHLAYDLVYNPLETRFLREAKSVAVPTLGGLAMLVSQAMAQSKIWTNFDAPMKEMSRAAFQKLQR